MKIALALTMRASFSEALLDVKKAAVFLESHELLVTCCSSNYIYNFKAWHTALI